MRFYFLLLACIICSAASFGQITKNNWMVGGSFSYSKVKLYDGSVLFQKIRLVNTSPAVGYFVIDKLATGIRAKILLSKVWNVTSQFGTQVSRQNQYDAGPFVRYYFLPVDNKINLFGDLAFTYGTHITFNSSDKLPDDHQYAYSVAGGMALFINSSIAAELQVEYSRWHEVNIDSHYKKLQLGIGLQIHLERDNN